MTKPYLDETRYKNIAGTPGERIKAVYINPDEEVLDKQSVNSLSIEVEKSNSDTYELNGFYTNLDFGELRTEKITLIKGSKAKQVFDMLNRKLKRKIKNEKLRRSRRMKKLMGIEYAP